MAQGKARVDRAELGAAREVPQVQRAGLGTREYDALVPEFCELEMEEGELSTTEEGHLTGVEQ